MGSLSLVLPTYLEGTSKSNSIVTISHRRSPRYTTLPWFSTISNINRHSGHENSLMPPPVPGQIKLRRRRAEEMLHKGLFASGLEHGPRGTVRLTVSRRKF